MYQKIPQRHHVTECDTTKCCQKRCCAILSFPIFTPNVVSVFNCVISLSLSCQTTKVILTKKFPKKGLGTCTWINKVHSSSWLYSCSKRGTNIARVEGWCLNNRPNCSVPETQMTAPGSSSLFLTYFPPQVVQEITVTSFYDVTIVCSTLLVGKPLHMCKWNAITHLHICQHHNQNPQLLLLHLNHIVFSLSWIPCLWHSPPGISVHPHTGVWNLFTTFKYGYKHKHV